MAVKQATNKANQEKAQTAFFQKMTENQTFTASLSSVQHKQCKDFFVSQSAYSAINKKSEGTQKKSKKI